MGSNTSNQAPSIECLKGLVGLSSKTDVQAALSGLYVDELPDISYAAIDKLTGCDQSPEEIWDEIETRAVYKLRTFFIREVNKCHKISDVSKCECLICANKALLATALWYLLGAEVMYTRATSSRMNSYTTIDNSKAKEMRDYFESQFENELEIAVRGIDIHNSTCFEEDEPEARDIVTFGIPIL